METYLQMPSDYVFVMKEYIEVSVRNYCGCYALLRKGNVVYVGQSKNVFNRVISHRNKLRRWLIGKPFYSAESKVVINFDTVRIYPCQVEELNRLEKRLIFEYQPEHNMLLREGEPPTLSKKIDIWGLAKSAAVTELELNQWKRDVTRSYSPKPPRNYRRVA